MAITGADAFAAAAISFRSIDIPSVLLGNNLGVVYVNPDEDNVVDCDAGTMEPRRRNIALGFSFDSLQFDVKGIRDKRNK